MDIGFYLLDVEPDNAIQNKIITAINDLCGMCPYDNIVLFNNQFNKIDVGHKYYMLHIQQAKYFDGILFVFDIKSAMLTQTFPSPKKQILYISNPEWHNNGSIPHGFWNNIYLKNNFEIITDNQQTYDLCEICWKKPLSLIQDINSQELQNVISQI